MDEQELVGVFNSYNEGRPVLVSAPGRVNLIGEHTDYNHGFVLPAAIDKRLIIAVGKNKDGNRIKFNSLDFAEELDLPLADLPEKLSGWQGYVKAIIDEILSRKLRLQGFTCVFASDIPMGAGMSSSAALGCGVIAALNQVFEWQLGKLEIAKIAQASEHRLGANVGLMDQFAVMFGEKNQAILLDCLDYSHQYMPLDLKEYSLLLINTNIKHELVDSAYNDRRASCERTLSLLQQKDPEISTLRDVSLKKLDHARAINPQDLKRVRYVLEENERVLMTAEALQKDDFVRVGELMYQSHLGLSKEYEVSCYELDLLVDLSRRERAILGARMMGGGFGGCTINLIKTSEAELTALRIMHEYKEQTEVQAESYLVAIDEGIKIT